MELISLNSTHPDRRTSIQKIASIVLHVLLLAAVTYQFHAIAKVHRRSNALRIVPYAPGHKAVVQPPKPKIVPPKDPPKLAMKQPEPPPPSSGGDPSGEADVSIAMANFYPAPSPDLSALPHGTHGDIVVDIVIDEEGHVVDTQVDQGRQAGGEQAATSLPLRPRLAIPCAVLGARSLPWY